MRIEGLSVSCQRTGSAVSSATSSPLPLGFNLLCSEGTGGVAVTEKMTMRLSLLKRIKRMVFTLILRELFLGGRKSRVTRLSAKFVFKIFESYPEAKLYRSREQLWKTFKNHLQNSEWVGFEFGVASGDATRTFLKMSYINNCLQWNGFDTFLGLPTAWGDLPQGAFSTNGRPPEIDNPIVKWHIGLIENTCLQINSLDYLDKNFVVIFDFDLYSATKSAWDQISKFLKPGDIIYFDEAYEADEERIINEIQLSNLQLEILGYTVMGIAYKII